MQELHARLQPLLIFTIDGANYIDVNDPKWEVVAAVQSANSDQGQAQEQQLVSDHHPAMVLAACCALLLPACAPWQPIMD